MRIDGSMNSALLKLSTMQRINSAADDAAGLAISEKMDAQVRGIEQGTENAQDMQNVARTAEGSLNTIEDSLQRIRELSVQASNGILTGEDKAIIQTEIDQLKTGIADAVKNTEFNGIKLLDGSFSNKVAATGANGTGQVMNIENTGLANLGIENFDVTGDFDISDIDAAIEKVSGSRAKLGATDNALQATINNNRVTAENEVSAKSQIRDADIAKQLMELNRGKITNQYSMFAQQAQMSQMSSTLNLLG